MTKSEGSLQLEIRDLRPGHQAGWWRSSFKFRVSFGFQPSDMGFPFRWHVTCSCICWIEYMATKIKLMKMLQEVRGLAQITSRRPPRKLPGLFLLQMRDHVARATGPRRTMIIPIDLQEAPDIPHPVKITHLEVVDTQPATVQPVPVLAA